MTSKNTLNELAAEFARNIITGADHEKKVLAALGIDLPDENLFYTYLVLWESWMFFVALGAENPPQGEEIFNKTHIQVGTGLRKITQERFMMLSKQVFPLFTNCMTDPQPEKLSDVLSTLLFGKKNVIDGFDDYVDQVTSTTIDFHRQTIREVLE